MSRARGRPARGQGVTLDGILEAALALLDEGGERGLTMRALAARLGVTPMSLYYHASDRAGLLRALADRVYGEVLEGGGGAVDPLTDIRQLLTRYHSAVANHPQLTLAILAEPAAFSGAADRITGRLTALLAALTPAHELWRDILVDHAHGSGVAIAAAHGDPRQAWRMQEQYRKALDVLLAQLVDGKARIAEPSAKAC